MYMGDITSEHAKLYLALKIVYLHPTSVSMQKLKFSASTSTTRVMLPLHVALLPKQNKTKNFTHKIM